MNLSLEYQVRASEYAQAYVLGTFIDCCNLNMRQEGFTWEKDFKNRVNMLIETSLPIRYMDLSPDIQKEMVSIALESAEYYIQDLLGVIKGTKDGDIVTSYSRFNKNKE
jgi:hypothetical protein